MNNRFNLLLILIIFNYLIISDLETSNLILKTEVINLNNMNNPEVVSTSIGREFKSLDLKVKRQSGQTSIYAEALNSIEYSKRLPDRSLKFNLKDRSDKFVNNAGSSRCLWKIATYHK